MEHEGILRSWDQDQVFFSERMKRIGFRVSPIEEGGGFPVADIFPWTSEDSDGKSKTVYVEIYFLKY